MEVTRKYSAIELLQFQSLAMDYWPAIDFTVESAGLTVPQPILARENNSIIGGLSYLQYPHPERPDSALWINAVLVTAPYRNQGLGSRLITFAMNEQGMDAELFAYTAIPSLYLKLGWQLVSNDGENYVLKFIQKNIQDISAS